LDCVFCNLSPIQKRSKAAISQNEEQITKLNGRSM